MCVNMLLIVRQKVQCYLLAPIHWLRAALMSKNEYTGPLIKLRVRRNQKPIAYQFQLQQTALTLSIVAIEISTYPLLALWLIWMNSWITNTILFLVTGVKCAITLVLWVQDNLPSLEEVFEEKFSYRPVTKKRR